MSNLPDPFQSAPAEAIPAWLEAPSEVVGRLLEAMYERPVGHTPRTALVGKLASIAQEHHHATLLLLRTGLNSAALALARPAHETYVKTRWALSCASDLQVQNINSGLKTLPDMKQLLADIEAVDPAEADSLRTWQGENRVLHDYTHTGKVQVGFWENGSMIEPNHPVEELQTCAGHASMMALMATACVAEAAQDVELLEFVSKTINWLDSQLPTPPGHSTHENGSGTLE